MKNLRRTKFIHRGTLLTSLNDPSLREIAQKRGIDLGTTVTMFRIEVSVSMGRSNFQLHAIMGLEGKKRATSKGKEVLKPRSKTRSYNIHSEFCSSRKREFDRLKT